MRDVVDTVLTGGHSKTHYYSDGTISTVKYSTARYGRIAKGRGDIRHGNGVDPEPYEAYRLKVGGGDYLNHYYYPYPPYHLSTVRSGKINFTAGSVEYGFKNGWEPNVPAWVIDSARANAIENLQGGNLDLGTAIAELPEGVQSLSEKVVQISKALHAARQKKYRKALKELGISRKDAGDSWLSVQYGVMPALRDLYNAQEAIKNALSKEEGRILRAKGTMLTKHTVGTPFTRWRSSSPITYGCEVGFLYRIDDAQVAGLASLGVTNPLSLVWELTSLSFVIDWIVPIGQFLRGLSGFHGCDYISGYQTTFNKFDGRLGDYGGSGNELTSSGQVDFDVNAFGMKRIKLVTAPQPGFAFRQSLNLSQAISALALLNQRI